MINIVANGMKVELNLPVFKISISYLIHFCFSIYIADGGVRRECSTKNVATLGCTLEKGNNECDICETDLCNGSVQYGPVALIIAIPAIIAKILSF